MTYEIEFTLEDGTEVEAEDYSEAKKKGEEEMERILGRNIVSQGFIRVIEK